MEKKEKKNTTPLFYSSPFEHLSFRSSLRIFLQRFVKSHDVGCYSSLLDRAPITPARNVTRLYILVLVRSHQRNDDICMRRKLFCTMRNVSVELIRITAVEFHFHDVT